MLVVFFLPWSFALCLEFDGAPRRRGLKRHVTGDASHRPSFMPSVLCFDGGLVTANQIKSVSQEWFSQKRGKNKSKISAKSKKKGTKGDKSLTGSNADQTETLLQKSSTGGEMAPAASSLFLAP